MLHELEETNDKLLHKKLMYIISHLENANLKWPLEISRSHLIIPVTGEEVEQ